MHEYKLSAAQQTQGRLWIFFLQFFFCISIIPIKLSISFMIARVAGPKRGYVYALWAVAGLMTVTNLVALLFIMFNCRPLAYNWNLTIAGGSCLPPQILAYISYADTAVNIASDWFCAILPIPLLWNIQMNRNSKFACGFLLSLGGLASLSACVRLKYTVKLNNKNDDYLYSIGDFFIWGYAEPGIGVIVGCISTLRPLLKRTLHLNDGSSGRQCILQKARQKRAANASREFDMPRPEGSKVTTTAASSGPFGRGSQL
ncbi:hypothetical protein LTR37_020108 [Vermiconidia calcicola]|uniref:Uncharacterized protein n=1 Tax=Vermiconidia calcicola TaxID=1690605 RepID=A0ACC3MCF6_9PEZI|nr:hypothetical protein LTR37_020108 [Vermiconidia calcicola]